MTLETHRLSAVSNHNDLTGSQQSRGSDRTASVSGSTSTDSDRTPVRVDSQDSQVSDTETVTDGRQQGSVTIIIFYLNFTTKTQC